MADAPIAGGMPVIDAADDQPCILVVDDESAITEEIIDWLEMRGIACHSAPEAGQAMKLLAEDPAITVMLTDINMPGIDGIALSTQALAARSEEHAMEVVVLTGHATREHAIGALRARALDFVAKPAPFATLEAALDRAHRSAVNRRRQYRDSAVTLRRLRASMSGLEAVARNAASEINNESRSAFLTAVGHEVLTALHQIVGFADLIGHGPGDMPIADLREYAEALLLAGTNLSEHTRMLLQLVESEAVPRPLNIAVCQVANLFAALAHDYATRARERGQRIRLDCPPELPLQTDAARLEEALRHLLSNALRIAPEAAVIMLAARATPADRVHLHVIEASDEAGARVLLEQAGHEADGDDSGSGFFRHGQGLAVGIAGLQAARLGGRLMVPPNGDGGIVTLRLPVAGPQGRQV
jgi:FixJ family two-component response regulator